MLTKKNAFQIICLSIVLLLLSVIIWKIVVYRITEQPNIIVEKSDFQQHLESTDDAYQLAENLARQYQSNPQLKNASWGTKCDQTNISSDFYNFEFGYTVNYVVLKTDFGSKVYINNFDKTTEIVFANAPNINSHFVPIHYKDVINNYGFLLQQVKLIGEQEYGAPADSCKIHIRVESEGWFIYYMPIGENILTSSHLQILSDFNGNINQIEPIRY
ncbi:MAG TPA: hypothetical protein VLL52_23760 [Anaerolineae bacterium]|nr:hypothetical protein [Anaerolineae bacterium]